jgi:hypothetical protein
LLAKKIFGRNYPQRKGYNQVWISSTTFVVFINIQSAQAESKNGCSGPLHFLPDRKRNRLMIQPTVFTSSLDKMKRNDFIFLIHDFLPFFTAKNHVSNKFPPLAGDRGGGVLFSSEFVKALMIQPIPY